MKRLLVLFILLAMTSTAAHAQGLSSGPQGLSDDTQESSDDTQESSDDAQESASDTRENQTFWSQEVDVNQEWGLWLKEVYRPYSDELSLAILKIVSSTINIDPTGKSNAELLEEVNEAYSNSLRSMEAIKAPAELKKYHEKVVELYKHTINSDPRKKSENALVRKQLSLEADQAITKAFQLHGVSQKIIDRFTAEY